MTSSEEGLEPRLDLADLKSVATCAARVKELVSVLDVVVCNASVMAVPTRLETADGFEMQ